MGLVKPNDFCSNLNIMLIMFLAVFLKQNFSVANFILKIHYKTKHGDLAVFLRMIVFSLVSTVLCDCVTVSGTTPY